MSATNSTDTTGDGAQNSSDDKDSLAYDPTLPAPHWHQNMELIFVCVCLGISLITILVRTFIKYKRVGRLRSDDWWMVSAAVAIIFPLWTCQIGSNRNGGGLHPQNVTLEQSIVWWRYSWGWCGYYIVTSFIKVSVCASFLQILPPQFKSMRRAIYVLCVLILSLGFSLTCVWLFECKPFMSNFDYNVPADSCIDVDYPRYAWCGISIFFDLIICAIPFQIVKMTKLPKTERMILVLVFVATFFGTIVCAVGLYGIWANRQEVAGNDLNYSSTPFVICNDVEILMYTIGGTLPAFSPYLISRVKNYTANRSGEKNSFITALTSPFSQGRSTVKSGMQLSSVPDDDDDAVNVGGAKNGDIVHSAEHAV